jgi:hypothetical protein
MTRETAGIYDFCAISYIRKMVFREFFGKSVIGYLERRRKDIAIFDSCPYLVRLV